MHFDPIDARHRASAFACTLPAVMTAEECAAHIAASEARGFAPAPITTFSGPVMRPDIRDNTRVMFDDAALADQIWDRLAPRLPRAVGSGVTCGLNERFRVYRYRAGQRFDWHRDGVYARSNTEFSRLSLLIYLNDDFTGGATEFLQEAVAPRQGMALAFAHPLRHRGAPVRTGIKYVLRTDVMVRAA